ncbi:MULTISPECIES: hypothetical protein [unclassified Streptomyces]|uniref:hypothetical protein n=1 Tax=unclassified Streptomyces TaxID=2593676 RepID=UPI0030782EDB
MTDTMSPRAATEGTWALPLLALAPLALVRLLTEPSTPWLAASWGLLALSAVLMAVGWSAVLRHGTRTGGAWATCLLVHGAFVWNVIVLVCQ